MSDLHDALVSGQPSEALAALRAVLGRALLDVDGKEKATVAKQLMAVIDAQQQIAVPEASASDDLAKQRAARRSAAKTASSA